MEIARMYLDGQRSFLAFVEPLGAEGWNRPVPCTPGWTVRDVLSHQAGLCDDVLNGRTDGAGSDPWTGAQIERWRDTDTSALIEQWRQQGPQLADVLERFNQVRPVFDVNTHEHDVRHALGMPGNRASEVVGVMAAGFASGQLARPISIEFDDGTTASIGGPSDAAPITLEGVTRFEFVRSRLGRRTRDQVAGYAWSEPVPDEILDGWFVFGPARQEIHE
jgi:uncharacterized protein (TIGR03083 family)